MGLIQPDELKKMIPMLEENISLAESILKRDPNNNDLKSVLESQKNTLREYKKRISSEKIIIKGS
ncbi:hypothetical protein EMG21_30150 [Klebsiella pneumoniae]|nr:hypothetical protein EMG21_30150 [Klebsiella pneumoniae]